MSGNDVKRPLIEQIEELKGKIALLEGDRRAYYESSFFAMQQNRDKVSQLRKEVYDLRRQLRDATHADEHVINQAFQNHPVEKAAFSHKTTVVAIEEMDFKVSDAMKRLNLMKSVTDSKQQKLNSLQQQLKDEQPNLSVEVSHIPNEFKVAQTARDLENRLDKLVLKCNEADFIGKTYKQIRDRLREEQKQCSIILDDMETDIRRCAKEQTELVVLHRDAVTNKDATLEELRRHEEYVYADKKRREIELTQMRKVAEDTKLENERVEKKVIEDTIDDVEGDSTSNGSLGCPSDDEIKELNAYAEQFKKLKEVTGIPDINGVIKKFECQLDTKQKLTTIIDDMEEKINSLLHEKASLQQQLDDKKANGDLENKKSKELVNEKKSTMVENQENALVALAQYDEISSFIIQAKAGLEHMMEKLIHLKASEKLWRGKISNPEEYMMVIFQRIKGKLQCLIDDLKDFDLDDYKQKMKMEEQVLVMSTLDFQMSIRKNLPANNTRVRPVTVNNERAVDDVESGDDAPEWKSRVMMKKASEEYIIMKTKKKQQRKKKKGK